MNNAKICILTARKIKRRRGKVEGMKVKDILKRYSMVSEGDIAIDVRSGEAKGLHVINRNGVNRLLEENAPIINKTVGLIYVIDNTLCMTAN